MVRAGASTVSKRNETPASHEEKAEEIERKRLRDLAFSRGLLSRTRSHVGRPLRPSKLMQKSDGKDIVKKASRKSKYLFSFPGLMAPIAGGKLGELSNLDSKNPVLYVEFPEGRLKLFGTIVYPKNKYLILHIQRGAGSILCEDVFESLVVFSIAQWVGTKEQNPEEISLPLPKCLEQVKHSEFDFSAGAGQSTQSNTAKQQNENVKQPSPAHPGVCTAGEVAVYIPTDSDNSSDSVSQQADGVMRKQQPDDLIVMEKMCDVGASRKRSRKNPEDETERSRSLSLDGTKNASKGKLAKKDGTPGANTGYKVKMHSSVGRSSGRTSAKRSKVVDLSGELSDATDEPSDDSDEDWAG